MSLKKKGVSSLVQKWQKVKKEVEKEERASEQRQQAIRQQLEEWKKENRFEFFPLFCQGQTLHAAASSLA